MDHSTEIGLNAVQEVVSPAATFLAALYQRAPEIQSNPLSLAERFDGQVNIHTADVINATWKDVVDPITGRVNETLAAPLLQDPKRNEEIKAIRLALSLKQAKLDGNNTLEQASQQQPNAFDEFLHATASGLLLVSRIAAGIVTTESVSTTTTDQNKPVVDALGLCASHKLWQENQCTALAQTLDLDPQSIMQTAEPLLLPAVAESVQTMSSVVTPNLISETLQTIPTLLLPTIAGSTA